MAEMTTAPRLDVAKDNQSYAPISWVAVLATVIAVVFLAVFISLAYTSFVKKQPLLLPSLLIMPLATFVLAFVARQQVRNSEGTRSGSLGRFNLIGFAWWVGIIGGLGYLAYLFAVEFAVRKDVETTFVEWSKNLNELNIEDPADPNLYLAFHKCIPPEGRKNLSAKDVRQMDIRFMNQLVGFRQSDIVRICQRNPGECQFLAQGLEKWDHTPKGPSNPVAMTDTRLACTLICPEGEYDLSITMKGFTDDAGRREWVILPSPEGMIKSARLTGYGRRVIELEGSARETVNRLFASMQRPGQQQKTYEAFIAQDNSIPAEANLLMMAFMRMGIGGGLLWNDPMVGDYEKNFAEKYFQPILPADGPKLPEDVKKLNEEMRKRFMYVWNTNRILPPKTMIRENPDQNPSLIVKDTVITLRCPVELILQGGDSAANTARGRVILECRDPKILAEVKRQREASKTEKPSATPVKDWDFLKVNWRVVRFESDLKPVPPMQMPGQKGGPGGGPPGMDL